MKAILKKASIVSDIYNDAKEDLTHKLVDTTTSDARYKKNPDYEDQKSRLIRGAGLGLLAAHVGGSLTKSKAKGRLIGGALGAGLGLLSAKVNSQRTRKRLGIKDSETT